MPTLLPTATSGLGDASTEASCSEEDPRAGAGWFESSWELFCGLEVSEVLEPETSRSTEPDELLSARA
jgi:hypothetical protein